MMRDLWLYVVTLPARWRARRLNLAFTKCGICREWFSADTVFGLINPACLMDSQTSGRLVCSKLFCQVVARVRNRALFGRDLADPYPAGVRTEDLPRYFAIHTGNAKVLTPPPPIDLNKYVVPTLAGLSWLAAYLATRRNGFNILQGVVAGNLAIIFVFFVATELVRNTGGSNDVEAVDD